MTAPQNMENAAPQKRHISALRNVLELLLGGLVFPAYVLLSVPALWRDAQGLRFALEFAGLWLLGILLAAVLRAWWWLRIGRKQAAARSDKIAG